MISDVCGATGSLYIVLVVGHLLDALIRWIPGFREDAPKRNLVLLIIYIQLLLFGFPLLRNLL